MPSAPLPYDEDERHTLLVSLNLLDTAPEPVFDRVTRLAARLLGVPIALFSLVDSERQWFKSRVGVAVAETPREVALCAHAILQHAPLVVEDASTDVRFMDNPMVTGEPHVRFYAGVPIRTTGGFAIGTLCAVDSKPRILTLDELQALEDLADIVSKEVQYRERLGLAQDRLTEAGIMANESESRFRSIFDLASIGIAIVAPSGAWISVNAALCEIVGYTEQELRVRTFQDITHPDDLDKDLLLLERLRRCEITQYQLEKRYIRKNGTVVWINLNVSCKRGPLDDIEYYVSVVKNIDAQKAAEEAFLRINAELEERVRGRTHELQNSNAMLTAAVVQQKRAEQALREREAELRSVIENANDAYICLDEQGRVTAWNLQAEHTFGWSAAEVFGLALTGLIIPPELANAHEQGMRRFLKTGKSGIFGSRLELPGRRRDGSLLTLEVRIAALEVNGRRIFSAFLHDISERKQEQAQREFESRHDTLTGLFNRRALMEQLPVAQKRAQRIAQPLALLFIDLDGFKVINDSWGHEVGDKLLHSIAQRLVANVRETDSVFRLAGDEFTVILENIHSDHDAVQVAEKLVVALSEPVPIGDIIAQVGASIGVAIYMPGDIADSTALIKQADAMMYRAKQAGRGRVRCSHSCS